MPSINELSVMVKQIENKIADYENVWGFPLTKVNPDMWTQLGHEEFYKTFPDTFQEHIDWYNNALIEVEQYHDLIEFYLNLNMGDHLSLLGKVPSRVD